jgi:hypothetical protein
LVAILLRKNLRLEPVSPSLISIKAVSGLTCTNEGGIKFGSVWNMPALACRLTFTFCSKRNSVKLNKVKMQIVNGEKTIEPT